MRISKPDINYRLIKYSPLKHHNMLVRNNNRKLTSRRDVETTRGVLGNSCLGGVLCINVDICWILNTQYNDVTSTLYSRYE